jgi:hypothetical protein
VFLLGVGRRNVAGSRGGLLCRFSLLQLATGRVRVSMLKRRPPNLKTIPRSPRHYCSGAATRRRKGEGAGRSRRDYAGVQTVDLANSQQK